MPNGVPTIEEVFRNINAVKQKGPFGSWGNFVHTLGDALTGGSVTAQESNMLNREISAQNLDITKENMAREQAQFDYTKELQQTIFQREDNAVTRRVGDLKRAGLSPVLAAGSAAGSGAVVATKAPQQEQRGQVDQKVPTDMLSGIRMLKDLSMTDQQMKLMQKQMENVTMDTKMKSVASEKIGAERDTALHNLNIAKLGGTSTNPSKEGKLITEGLSAFKNMTGIDIPSSIKAGYERSRDWIKNLLGIK